MNKVGKVFLFLGIGLLVVLGIIFVIFKLNNTDAKKFYEEYPTVTKENVFVYKSVEEIIDILEDGTGIVYLGFPECKWCQAYAKILNEVAKEENLKEIYYFNIKEDRSNNTEAYQKIVSIIGDYLTFNENGNKRIYVPDVTAVLNGKIVSHDNETSTIDGSLITPDEYWSDANVEFTKGKLRAIINGIQETTCTNCN